ncbi:hypothetical protein AB0F91_26300 [Amycolatopsis sp. NPDC023774]|uniref:hypothetical protein n=1 Tax=Amycolatopsis sp. NPDC023774 TaxID=3155015 RepID=UPI003403C0EE
MGAAESAAGTRTAAPWRSSTPWTRQRRKRPRGLPRHAHKVDRHGAASPPPAPDSGWAEEIRLDLDAVSATCPDCRILSVEAASPDTTADDGRRNSRCDPGSRGELRSYGDEDPTITAADTHLDHPGINRHHRVVRGSCGGLALCDLLLTPGLAQGADGWVQVGGTSLSSPVVALAGNSATAVRAPRWPVRRDPRQQRLLWWFIPVHRRRGLRRPTGLGTPNSTAAF